MWLYRAICNISTLSHISLYKVSIIMWHELVLFCEWVGFFLWFFFLYFPPFSQQFSLPPTNSPLSNDSYHPGRVKANILPSDISTPQPTARFRTAAHAALQGSVKPLQKCPLPHTWHLRLASVATFDRGEIVCRASPPESMANSAPLARRHRWLLHHQISNSYPLE